MKIPETRGVRQPDIYRQKAPEKRTDDFAKARLEAHKIENDPVVQFLHKQGFKGTPEITYSIDIVAFQKAGGEALKGTRRFSNYEDLQRFVSRNLQFIADENGIIQVNRVPFRIQYGNAVNFWLTGLDPVRDKQLSEGWDRLLAEIMDTKNFEPEVVNQTPTGKKKIINRAENTVLSDINRNQQQAKTIASEFDLDRIIREIAVDARQFENPDQKGLAEFAGSTLTRIKDCLRDGDREDFMKLDQLIGDFLYRSLSQRISAVLNRTDLIVDINDKIQMGQISLELSRNNSLKTGKTRAFLRVEQKLDRLLQRYEKK